MIRFLLSVALLMFALLGITQQALDFNNLPKSPELLPASWINSGYSERDFALSPDGTELFFTLQLPEGSFQTILYSRKDRKGTWTKPELAPFAGNFSDLEPAFSYDGKRLYFSSNRPLSGNDIKDFDIWMSDKENGVWGAPKNLGPIINTAADEFYPSITRNGNLYFTAAYKTGIGKEDIYVSRLDNGIYLQPVPLDTAINSKSYEFNAFVSPEEDYILFTGYGRKDDKGKGDLYLSIKDNSGHWLPAKNLVFLNSNKIDYCPFVSFDKKIMFFTSGRNTLKKIFGPKPTTVSEIKKVLDDPQNGNEDIYWVSFAEVLSIFK